MNEQNLAQWMRANVPGFTRNLQLEWFAGGQSNPTYRVRTPKASYVLRRKPEGTLLVISALSKAGFPVPRVYGLCEDPSVIGSAFYVMDMVEGRIFWDASFSVLPREERAAHMDAMNATLAALHRIDVNAIGLGDYGRTGGYVARQVARWSKQYAEDEAAGRHPAMDRLVEWLPAHLPSRNETTLVHGDFRADNMIFHPIEPRVIAVLDWELSTLGDPLADFAYHAMTYRMPRDVQGGIAGLDPAAHGLPTESEYVAAYCRHTGRDAIPDLDYYIAFNMFRFAAILHGRECGRESHGRVVRARGGPGVGSSGRVVMPALTNIDAGPKG